MGSAQSDSCGSGVYLFDGETFTKLEASEANPGDSVFETRSPAGLVYVESSGGCWGDGTPSTLSAYDPATGATTYLVGPPPPHDGAPTWWLGLSSWVAGD